MDLMTHVTDYPVLSAIIQVIGAYLASYFASISLEAPRSLVVKAGTIGAIGYAIYIIMGLRLEDTLATFTACLIVSLISHWAARRFKAPVTIFYIPAFFPFVPGSAIYQTAFNFIDGNVQLAGHYLVTTFQIAGAIALGVFIADSTIEIYNTVRRKLAQKRMKEKT